MVEWQELDAIIESLQQEHAEHWQQVMALFERMDQIRPHAEIIEQQFEALQVRELLHVVNERLLRGFGTLQFSQSGFGIERSAALVWPAAFDPRADDEDAQPDALYRIDIWMGPGPEDGRPRVRIGGAKRLEATLPTGAERFRMALLAAVRAPLLVQSQASENERDADMAAPAMPGTGEGDMMAPDAREADAAPYESDAAPGGPPEAAATPASDSESSAAAPAESPSADAAAIPMGPAEPHDAAEPVI